MWTSEGCSAAPRDLRKRYPWASVVIFGGLLLSGCGNDGSPLESDSVQSAPSAPTTAPAADPQPSTAADLFPEGAGRSLVLESCGSCHAVACAAIGQRTAARWDNLKLDHADKVPNLSEQDRETLFGYLKEHFNDGKPEPKVSPDLLTGGCTPF